MISSTLGQALGPYLDPTAIGIVGGGTVLAVLLRTELGDLGRAVAALPVLLRGRFRADPLLDQIAALGRIAARHGVMTLDRSVIADADVSAAIAAIVDGTTPEAIQLLSRHARQARIERHLAAADVWASAAEVAPAMGMVGTLIGLVKMFISMSDPAAIGGAMAVALLATLYGALIASLIAMPIAARLRRQARAEAFERSRLEAPLMAMAMRELPRHRDQPQLRERSVA
ncbi:motility protein A [Sphingomonas sp. 28-63-12]|uniref:motility protein A n=1 Tax=Sphingomonas sp. 28-63-12 TaxID=1970434 RepID=UPI000BD78E47|nr:MAG: biopolymer transporter ExbB [Sphingomonas sp. 28-63-12]